MTKGKVIQFNWIQIELNSALSHYNFYAVIAFNWMLIYAGFSMIDVKQKNQDQLNWDSIQFMQVTVLMTNNKAIQFNWI